MNAVAALAATDTTAWSLVEALWEAPIPSGHFRYYNGMLYLLGLMHVTGNFKIYANTSAPIPGANGAVGRCWDTLASACRSAQQSSVGNCLICCGQHQHALMAAHCTQPDFDRYCRRVDKI